MKIGIWHVNGDPYSSFGDEKFKKIREHGFSCVDYDISDTTGGIYKMSEKDAFDFAEREKNLQRLQALKFLRFTVRGLFPISLTGLKKVEKNVLKNVFAPFVLLRAWVVKTGLFIRFFRSV